MILYRPVGLIELALIYDLDFKAFPPRLPEQPIFYPVLNAGYAEQIARDWNTKSNSFAGFVTRFSINDDFIQQYEIHVVGSSTHEELWIPAESLSEFNQHIDGRITVTSAFFGEGFVGFIPDKFGLKGKAAGAQIRALAITLDYSTFDFCHEVLANGKAVFLNYKYWLQTDPDTFGLNEIDRDRVLETIKEWWAVKKPEIQLT